MADYTKIFGLDQIEGLSIDKSLATLDFLGSSDWDISNSAKDGTITGLRDGTADSDVATYGQLVAAIEGLSAGLEYKGTFDADTPAPDLDALDNTKGDFYKVSVAGTYLGVEYAVGDNLYFNKDVASGTTVVAADIDKIDNTESPDILRTGDVIDNLLSTEVAKPLSANQGRILKGLIDALDAQVNSRKYGESLTFTVASTALGALANTPVAGTIRLYKRGLRMFEGNDYTIVGTAITMVSPARGNDVYLVDYEY